MSRPKAANMANETTGDLPVECGYCGRSFLENRGQPACRSCPLGNACRYVRCPACGYENPVEPTWLSGLKRLVAR
jgi:hypothetical protein